jgi:carbon storage regulator
MLVLSRQRDETIMIGDDIELTVVDIRGDKVRLGIKAPTHVAVHRKEVYDAIKRENEEAARLAGGELGVLPPRIKVPPGPRPPLPGATRIGPGADQRPGNSRRESA